MTDDVAAHCRETIDDPRVIAAAKDVAARLPDLSPEKLARVRMLLYGEVPSSYVPPSPAEPEPAPVPAPRAPVDPPLAGVYFARSGDAIKIGMSTDVGRRIRSLSTASPDAIELLAVMPGGSDEERKLHSRFAHLRLNGEWFRADAELLDFIATLPPLPGRPPRRRGGRPSTVLGDEQAALLRHAADSAEVAQYLKEAAWEAALAAREAGVPDEMLCDETGLSRATLNRKYGPRREAED